MSRIFWDAMLFIYLLEDNKQFAPRIRELLGRFYRRRDVLLTSQLALGEAMAGGAASRMKSDEIRTTMNDMGFGFLSFDANCVETFSRLRSLERLKAPDSIHLACAASSGVDMFLTNDTQLLKRRLHVPGIRFIADFNLPIF